MANGFFFGGNELNKQAYRDSKVLNATSYSNLDWKSLQERIKAG